MTMVAGEAQVRYLRDHRDEVFPYLAEQGDRMAREINEFCESEGIPARMLNAYSMFHLHFTRKPIESARDVSGELRKMEREFYLHLLYNGVVVPGLHLAFISTAHTPDDVDFVIDAFKKSFLAVRDLGD